MKQLFNILFFVLSVGMSSAQNTVSIDFKQKFKEAIKAYEAFEEQHGHFIQTDHVNMHYSTWGNPKHTPLVWIHGSYQNTTELLDIVDRIVEDEIYVIAIDYYGHGLTKIPNKEVSIYNVADDIKVLLEHLEINKAIIGGLSRGGTIASAFYDSYPFKVLALILEDGGSVNWLRSRQELPKETVIKRYTEMYKHRRDTSFTTQFEAYSYYYDKTNKSNQYWLFAYIKENHLGQWAMNIGLAKWLEESSFQESLDGIFKPSTCTLFKSSTLFLEPKIVFRNLHVPMLIFDPTKDDDNGFMAFTEDNAILKAKHPNLITHLIYNNATHMLHYQQPERFVKDVLEFINTEHLKEK